MMEARKESIKQFKTWESRGKSSEPVNSPQKESKWIFYAGSLVRSVNMQMCFHFPSSESFGDNKLRKSDFFDFWSCEDNN